MNESIVLLSSMSPKVKTNSYFKGTSILALKKNIRRSSICDKSVRTLSNEEIFMVDDSASSDATTNSLNNLSHSNQIVNETAIVISDTYSSVSSDSNGEIRRLKSPQKVVRGTNSCLLSKEKIDINSWMDGINQELQETIYSEISTINGDIGDNFVPKERGNAVNSTFIGPKSKRFDEIFKKTEQKGNDNYFCTSGMRESMQKLIIEDSFEDCEQDLNNEHEYHPDLDKDGHKSSEEKEAQKTPIYKPEDMESEIGSLLDSIYGKKWREKQDQILPKSEPQKKESKYVSVTYSERKQNTIPYKNPYLESEQSKSQSLLQKLQRTRFNEKFESPIVKKINELCDLDTNSENSPIVSTRRKAILTFDDSSDEIDEKTELNKNNENEQDNFDISDLGLSLEQKIRQKILKIPEIPKKFKVKEKQKNGISRPKKKSSEKDNITKPKISSSLQEVAASRENSREHKTDENTKKKGLKTNDNCLYRNGTKQSSNSSSISISSDDDDEWNRRISTITYDKPASGTYSFLASLSANVPIEKCDMSARIYRNNFKNFKNQLLTKLFSLYNEKVFDKVLPENTPVEWNDKMRKTAGYCYCRKISRKNGAVERSARIVLSTKVIDSAERLRDTLIHEMCHAAAWIVHCISDGHGKLWKSWAFKAMTTFPELPPIKRCHDYVINTKYTYRCIGCGYSVGRHSKSLNIERKRCGYCFGKFEIFLNKVGKKGETGSVVLTPKKEASGFALFVKKNYGSVKNANLKHGDVMKILGQKFQEMKVTSKN